jgi:hypothetical protein
VACALVKRPCNMVTGRKIRAELGTTRSRGYVAGSGLDSNIFRGTFREAILSFVT